MESRLVFAYLCEDNIQHAYFSVRPLVDAEGTAFTDEELAEAFPDCGTLRVVPDRREQHVFKERLRNTGKFCVLNLLRYPLNSGKLRTNKNYNPAREEKNRQIIYSDVVVSPPASLFYTVLTCAPEEAVQRAGEAQTPSFFVLHENALYGPVSKEAPQVPGPAREMEAVLHTLTLPDGLSCTLLVCPDELQKEQPRQAAAKAPQSPVLRDEKPSLASSQPGEAAREEASSDQPPAGEKEQRPPEKAKAAPPPPAVPEQRADRASQKEDRRNIRVNVQIPRNRLQALIFSQTKDARRVQQAANLPDHIRMREVTNPVEQALECLQKVWAMPESRQKVFSGLMELDGFQAMLDNQIIGCSGEAQRLQTVMNRQINALETERIATLVELDRARSDMHAFREEALQSLSAKRRGELDKLEQRIVESRSMLDSLRQQAGAMDMPLRSPSKILSESGVCDTVGHWLSDLAPDVDAKSRNESVALFNAVAMEPAPHPEKASSYHPPEGSSVSPEDAWHVLAPVCAGIPEEVIAPLKEKLCLYASACSVHMIGGLPTACDWALRLWLLPLLRDQGLLDTIQPDALAAFPLSASMMQREMRKKNG